MSEYKPDNIMYIW